MAIKRYLDETGLQTLWNKIKTIFLTKEDANSIANSLNLIKENVGLESGLTLPSDFEYETIIDGINIISSKQDKLIAGTNITINGNTISTNTLVVTGVTTSGTGNVITGFTKNNGLVTLGKAYVVDTITYNGSTLTNNNGTVTIPTIERGNRWTCGTAITGTSTTGTIFSGSGITDAIVGDMYLNTSTCYVYQCTFAGNASTAKWSYRCNIGQTRLG